MKKYKNLILFLVITFLRSIFLAMAKIFLRSALKEDNRTLEEIAGYISLGATISYFIGGALNYTFRKKPIVIVSGIVVIICLIYGYMTDYFPLKNFAFIISIMGFFYGLRLTVKGILTTVEIMESGLGETKINAITNIVIFLGLLTGSYWGFDIYDRLQGVGVIGLIGTVALATILILFTKYDINFKKHTLHSAITKNIPNIFGSIKKYFSYLIPIGVLRAISTAVGQKMLEIGIDIMNKTPTKGIIVIVVSMVGAIVGHIISTPIIKRKRVLSTLLTILLAISIMFFPNFLAQKDTFLFMMGYSAYLGVIFGVIVNLIEGRFYHQIGEDNRKEFGSAAYGIITSIIIFLIMIIGNNVTKKIGINASFIFYGITVAAIIPFIRRVE
ncbi:hypothetical protein P148_SR1C00001G0548 [candidate division SR1 bacterium RAAC1_SR1_1]|nr:hypothetical protein P148_SR1C00001G0548 [candidate division SR1 bacterium RAAC1_SR1_1]